MPDEFQPKQGLNFRRFRHEHVKIFCPALPFPVLLLGFQLSGNDCRYSAESQPSSVISRTGFLLRRWNFSCFKQECFFSEFLKPEDRENNISKDLSTVDFNQPNDVNGFSKARKARMQLLVIFG